MCAISLGLIDGLAVAAATPRGDQRPGPERENGGGDNQKIRRGMLKRMRAAWRRNMAGMREGLGRGNGKRGKGNDGCFHGISPGYRQAA